MATSVSKSVVLFIIVIACAVRSMPVAPPSHQSGTTTILEDDRAIDKRAVMASPIMRNNDAINEPSDYANDRVNDDDLETAAGTNVLRPLFVYRQQLAYRERARKAGRRSAPNFI